MDPTLLKSTKLEIRNPKQIQNHKVPKKRAGTATCPTEMAEGECPDSAIPGEAALEEHGVEADPGLLEFVLLLLAEVFPGAVARFCVDPADALDVLGSLGQGG